MSQSIVQKYAHGLSNPSCRAIILLSSVLERFGFVIDEFLKSSEVFWDRCIGSEDVYYEGYVYDL
ncbi:MAG: hypothetical protein QMD10_11575, partial [Desulfitobacteriaceae bacterium]|nr:hypothetical protein [Desulfitobacteriaceae bacterium]